MRPKSSLFYGLLVIAIGILLIAFNNRGELLSWVVILAGLALIIPCVFTLINAVNDNRRASHNGTDTFNQRLMTTGVVITSVIGIALGLWMIVSPNFFIGFIAYGFAVLLILYGIYHLCVVIWLCRPLVLPGGFYIIPILMIIAGLVILFTSVRYIKSAVIIITGIGLIGAGVSSILEFVAAGSSKRAIERESRSDGQHTI